MLVVIARALQWPAVGKGRRRVEHDASPLGTSRACITIIARKPLTKRNRNVARTLASNDTQPTQNRTGNAHCASLPRNQPATLRAIQ